MDTQNLNSEIWKPVVGYEGLYSVSNLGRIRAETSYRRWVAGRILKPWSQGTGYFCVALTRERKVKPHTIHKLVMAAFSGPRPKGQTINHKDGAKANNAAGNLEYATSKENSQHASKNGLLAFGSRNRSFKLTPDVIDRAHSLQRAGNTQRQIARALGLSESCISNLFHRY